MDSKKFVGNDENEKISGKMSEIKKIQNEFSYKDKIFHEELRSKDMLLDKFELYQLKQLCIEELNREPEIEYFEVEPGKKIELPLDRNDYKNLIIEELRLAQIKDYSIKHEIVTNKFI